MHVCTFKNLKYKYFLFIYLFFNEKAEQKEDPQAPSSPPQQSSSVDFPVLFDIYSGKGKNA